MPPVELHEDSGLPMVDQGGDMRVLAALPSPLNFAFPLLSKTNPTLPESDWVERDLRPFADKRRRDQHRSSACTGYSTTTAARFLWKIMQGGDHLFAPFFPYSLVAGGKDAGASIFSILTALSKYGLCLEPTLPELSQGVYRTAQIPQAAFQEAKRFGFEAYRAPTFESFATGIHLGYVGVVGLAVGNNFGKLDDEGVCPLPDTVLGGHALPIIGLKRGPKTGRVILPFENSWSNAWGDDGFGAITKEHFNPVYGFQFDSYLIRVAFSDPQDADPENAILEGRRVGRTIG